MIEIKGDGMMIKHHLGVALPALENGVGRYVPDTLVETGFPFLFNIDH